MSHFEIIWQENMIGDNMSHFEIIWQENVIGDNMCHTENHRHTMISSRWRTSMNMGVIMWSTFINWKKAGPKWAKWYQIINFYLELLSFP